MKPIFLKMLSILPLYCYWSMTISDHTRIIGDVLLLTCSPIVSDSHYLIFFFCFLTIAHCTGLLVQRFTPIVLFESKQGYKRNKAALVIIPSAAGQPHQNTKVRRALFSPKLHTMWKISKYPSALFEEGINTKGRWDKGIKNLKSELTDLLRHSACCRPSASQRTPPCWLPL